MASATKKKASKKKEELQLELIYSDETQFKYWESHLFNDVYLRKDLPVKHKDVWEFEEDLGFQNFMKTLRDLAVEYDGREKELQNWSETETINNWIKHVLNGLGWSNDCSGVQNPYLEETSFRFEGKTYRTDLLAFKYSDEKKYISKAKSNEKMVQARGTDLIPIEAKYWNRLEQYRQGLGEEKKRLDAKIDDTSKTSTPNEQTIKYMEILKKDWGILTDGAKWRLFNRELSAEDSNRYYEFNLGSLIDSIATEETECDRQEVNEAAKYFYFFFSKSAIYPEDEGEQPLVEEVLSFSKKYVNQVEEDLKDRFVKAMNFACNGFYKSAKKYKLNSDMNIIRNISESSLFNILFTKSLESRNILPMNSTDYRKVSLSSIVDKIERFDPEKEVEINIRNLSRAFKKSNGSSFIYKDDGTELHDKIVRLTKIIHDGKSKKDDFGFEISGFRESVFSNEEWKFFQTCKLSNRYWVNILFQLGYAESDTKTRKYQQIPYSYFTPRQLGSIYESFLEFQLDKAEFDMVFEKKQWKKADLKSRKYKGIDLPKVFKGDLFFTPDNKDRKATGSYYTPDYIVKNIIQRTLSPLVKGRSSSEILKLTICDPAMGSGHFLVGALNFVTKIYLERLSDEAEGDLNISLPEAKRKVLDSCIFGIDINCRAVKLAKMSLWLETAYINKKLENLDDQLIEGDALSEDKPWVKNKKGGLGKFNAIVSNPPYLKVQNITTEKRRIYSSKFESYVGATDIYVLFIERYMQFLTQNGRFGVICPNSIKDANFAVNIREKLSSINVELIWDFGLNQVFKGATTYTMLLFVENAPYSGETYARVSEDKSNDKDILLNYQEKKIEISNGKWQVSMQESLASSINGENTLNDFCDSIFVGLQITPSQLFGIKLLSEEGDYYIVKSKLEDNPFKIEKEICKKLLKSSDIKKSKFNYSDNLVIFPYKKIDGKYRLIEYSEYKKYTQAFKYIEKHKQLLFARDKGKWAGRDDYYAYSRVQNLELHEKEKIIICGTSSEARFSFCSPDYFLDRGSFGIILNSKGLKNKEKLLAILNSSVLDNYVKALNKPISGGYYPYQTKTIDSFPIPSKVLNELPKKPSSEDVKAVYEAFCSVEKNKAA